VFRRVVVGLAILVGSIAWLEGWWSVLAICTCVGIGELLESSYYIGVLGWAGRQGLLSTPKADGPAARS
jgi:hypothetical protein